jgi:hypothetical protein
MRTRFLQLSSTMIFTLLAMPLSAQQVPDFSGQWQRADNNDVGSGWGDTITVTQEGSRLQVEYVYFAPDDRQPPLTFVYDLAGRETRNTLMMGRGEQTQVSRTKLVDGSLDIVTLHELVVNGQPVQSEVHQVLSLQSNATLVMDVTRMGVLGGPPTKTRSVYRRVSGV